MATAATDQSSDGDFRCGRLIINEIDDFPGVVAVNHKGPLPTDWADFCVRVEGGHKITKPGCG